MAAAGSERTCSIAMTEPEAGSDAAGIRTTATPDGGGWRLNGHKRHIGDGAFSDFFVVSARRRHPRRPGSIRRTRLSSPAGLRRENEGPAVR